MRVFRHFKVAQYFRDRQFAFDRGWSCDATKDCEACARYFRFRSLAWFIVALLLAACGGSASDHACTSSTPGVAQHCAKLGLLVCEVDEQSFCAVEPEPDARCCR